MTNGRTISATRIPFRCCYLGSPGREFHGGIHPTKPPPPYPHDMPGNSEVALYARKPTILRPIELSADLAIMTKHAMITPSGLSATTPLVSNKCLSVSSQLVAQAQQNPHFLLRWSPELLTSIEASLSKPTPPSWILVRSLWSLVTAKDSNNLNPTDLSVAIAIKPRLSSLANFILAARCFPFHLGQLPQSNQTVVSIRSRSD